MKRNLILAVVVMLSSTVMAKEIVLLDDAKELQVEVSEKNVFCQNRGFGRVDLKIHVKELAGWAVLNHKQVAFGKMDLIPGMMGDSCVAFAEDGDVRVLGPEDVIKGNPRVELTVVERKLIEKRKFVKAGLFEDVEPGTMICKSQLEETLVAEIGGFQFRSTDLSFPQTIPDVFCKN